MFAFAGLWPQDSIDPNLRYLSQAWENEESCLLNLNFSVIWENSKTSSYFPNNMLCYMPTWLKNGLKKYNNFWWIKSYPYYSSNWYNIQWTIHTRTDQPWAWWVQGYHSHRLGRILTKLVEIFSWKTFQFTKKQSIVTHIMWVVNRMCGQDSWILA